MSLNDLLTTLLTSTVVSAFVSFVLKSVFESRLQYYLQKELEKLRQEHALELEKIKSGLIINVDKVHQVSERQLSIYPNIVEIIYRTRNMARDITYIKQSIPTLSDELGLRVYELEEKVYANRMDLERDGIFDDVHEYKNTIMSFHRLDKDLRHFYEINDDDEINNIISDMRILYSKVESDYHISVDKLSKLMKSS